MQNIFHQHGKMFFVALMMISVLGQFGTELYLPSMPSMAVALHVPIHIIQLSITIYVLGFGIGSLVCGMLSDKYGRKPVIFICLVIGMLGSVVCCIAFNIDTLLVGRLIQGFGFSGLAVNARSIVRDVSHDRESMSRLASIMGILFASAVACAPIIGGYIEKYTFWRVNFILLLALALLAAKLCSQHMPETNDNKRDLSIYDALRDGFTVITNRQFLFYNITSSLTFTGFVAYQTISSFLLQIKVGLSPEQFGYTALIVTGALLLGNIINSRIVAKVGMDQMLLVGCYLFTCAGAIYIITGLFAWTNLYIVLIPIALFTMGAGMVYPNASSGALTVFEAKAGAASSMYNFMQMLGGTIGSYTVSINHANNQTALGVIFTIVGMSGIIMGQRILLWKS